MEIKWSPQVSSKDWSCEIIDDNTIVVNGETYSFPIGIPVFDPSEPIMDAHRDATGVLELTVLRTYKGGNGPIWDDMQYRDYPAGVIK